MRAPHFPPRLLCTCHMLREGKGCVCGPLAATGKHGQKPLRMGVEAQYREPPLLAYFHRLRDLLSRTYVPELLWGLTMERENNGHHLDLLCNGQPGPYCPLVGVSEFHVGGKGFYGTCYCSTGGRGPLLEVWERNKKLLEQKTPWWLSPIDILTIKKTNIEGERWTYEDLLVKTETGWRIRPYEEIKNKLTGWIQFHQINSIWTEDKKNGISEKKSRFQIEILENKTKLLSKMYSLLLEWDTKDEEVKEVMVRWAMDFGHNIVFDKWKALWNKGMRFSACTKLRENMYKMMYRWYVTPVKLEKIYKTGDKLCWKYTGGTMV
uniref:uncharacterized protein LOC114590233 n=1 Tax=Podarcis muralis TaxID=64176 RepID=UPI0010A02150|nr:uncharacterized protein LOC114590233 [Podarcis muralis]